MECNMELNDIERVMTKAEARALAVKYQHWASEMAMSWQEIAVWQDRLARLARRFGLVEEFEENGII